MKILLDPINIWRPALAIIITFIVANAFKLFTEYHKTGKFAWRGNGGMPSSHSAGVVSLATVILFEDGLSLLFLAVLVFAIIVVIDAVGVRRETAKHSAFLNDLVKKNMFKIVGHEPIEAFAGVLVGIVVPLLVYSFL